jgi:hypothetical protein
LPTLDATDDSSHWSTVHETIAPTFSFAEQPADQSTSDATFFPANEAAVITTVSTPFEATVVSAIEAAGGAPQRATPKNTDIPTYTPAF